MDAVNLYDDDIYAWAEQQAAVLRRLAGLQGLPNELDLAHVVEEIADLGSSELNGAKSCIRNILTHLILSAIDPDANAVRHWGSEVVTWQSDLRERRTPAMQRRIDLNVLWSNALRAAAAHLAAYYDNPAAEPIRHITPLRGTPCPFGLDDLTAADFDVLAGRDQIRARLAS